MNQDIQPNNTQEPEITPQPAAKIDSPLGKVKSVAVEVFNKFKKNKILFWTAIGFISLVMLIIITGLLFGKKGNSVPNSIPSTVPFILPTPNATPGITILSVSREKLNKLKILVDQLDVEQGRLKPPDLNFEVRF